MGRIVRWGIAAALVAALLFSACPTPLVDEPESAPPPPLRPSLDPPSDPSTRVTVTSGTTRASMIVTSGTMPASVIAEIAEDYRRKVAEEIERHGESAGK